MRKIAQAPPVESRNLAQGRQGVARGRTPEQRHSDLQPRRLPGDKQLSGKRDLRLKRGERLYHELITEVVLEGQRLGEIRPGDPHLATRLAMGTANSLLRWYTPAGAISAQELTSATVEYMLAGLAAKS
jgi:Tetracyclin repressor-like, C-terminal domain